MEEGSRLTGGARVTASLFCVKVNQRLGPPVITRGRGDHVRFRVWAEKQRFCPRAGLPSPPFFFLISFKFPIPISNSTFYLNFRLPFPNIILMWI